MKNLVAFMLIGLGMFLGLIAEDRLVAFAKKESSFLVSPAALYQSDNELYYNNTLPKAEVVEGESPDGDNVYGVTIHTTGTDHYKIFISPTNNDSMMQERWTVLHETCHVKLWSDAEANGTVEQWRYKDAHGDEFDDCMLTLAKKKAFHNVW